jgi:type II secretory pathway pseudopilin PulG
VNTCSSPISASRLRREDGFGLIEVMVSVVMLAVITLGVLAMIDGPSAVSGASKARSTASALAQQDQDRMRGMTVTDLSGYSGTRPVVISGVSYTVRSKASWVSDASGTESCTSNDNQAHYLKILSTVTWPAIGSRPPVQAASLMAPPASLSTTSGSLAVQVTDQAGAPVTNMTVRANPGNFVADTNAAGCAFFGALAIGNVTAGYGMAGWVDPAGSTNVTLAGSVSGGTTTTMTASYAEAAQVAVSFDTKVGGAAPAPARATQANLVNPSVPPPGIRTFTASTPAPTINATNLYPFTSGYGVYAGSCTAANPVTYNVNYFTAHPGSYARPGPRGTAAVTVRQPALNVKVLQSGAPLANATVRVKATASGCTERYDMTTDSAGLLVMGASPYQAPAVPFGPYSVCAQFNNRSATTTFNNTESDGNQAPQVTVSVPRNGNQSVCAP